MSMYSDLRKKLDDSLFVKLDPGQPFRFRLLDHPWISQRSFTEDVIDKDTGERRTENRISTQFHWPVYDYQQQRVRVLSQGKQVFDKIAGACEIWPNGDTMPSVFDVVIERFGTGRFDTKYDVQTIPYVTGMPVIPSAQFPDMQRASKGIPVQQILQGKKPPLLAANAPLQPPEQPYKPTHTEAEQLDATQAEAEQAALAARFEDPPEPLSQDVVPTGEDIDATSKIDLNDIPF